MIRQHDLLLGLIVLALIGFSATRNQAMSEELDPSSAQRRHMLEVGKVYCKALLTALDQNGDGALNLNESGWQRSRFAAADLNGDGVLSRVELTLLGAESVALIQNSSLTVVEVVEAL